MKTNCFFVKRNGYETLWGTKGFTLIELIVVMAIVAIAAMIAIPSFNGVITNNAVTTATNDLVSALNLARSEAVTLAGNVTVCKSANQTACTTANNWEQGWIVFSDVDADGVVDGATDDIIRVYNGPGTGITMTGNTKVASRLTYASTGFFSASFDGTITVTSGSKTIEIITDITGRVRTNRP